MFNIVTLLGFFSASLSFLISAFLLVVVCLFPLFLTLLPPEASSERLQNETSQGRRQALGKPKEIKKDERCGKIRWAKLPV